MKQIGTRDDKGVAARIVLTIACIVAALLVTGYTVLALPGPRRATATFSVVATPSSPNGTVHRGRATSYRITVRWNAGSSHPVTLTASDLPARTSARFVPGEATVTPQDPSTTLVVETHTAALPGDHVFMITARGGDEVHQTTATLRIVRLRSSRGLTVSPRSATLAAGGSTTFTICLTRTRRGRPVRLRVGSLLPAGTVVSFRPNPITRGCSTLTLTTPTTAPPGTYVLRIVGRGRRHRLRTTVAAIVGPASPPTVPHPTTSPPPAGGFTVSGDAVRAIFPGGPASPVNLRFHNPASTTIFVTGVTVTISGTSAGARCTTGNFTTTDFSYGVSGPSSGSGGVEVPPGQTASLQGAGVDPQYWPTVGMVDAGDQEACEGASVTLSYSNGQAYSP